MQRSSMGITPQPSVGLCGDTHLERCSQELDQFTKFHSSDYITGAVDLDLQNSKAMESAATVWFNMGETGEVKCKYVPKASLGNITTRWKGLRWAMPSKVFIAPLQHLLFFFCLFSLGSGKLNVRKPGKQVVTHTHTHT